MAIDRRQLMTGAAGALASHCVSVRPTFAGQIAAAHYAAACVDAGGAHAVAVFRSAGDELSSTPLPARGHDIAMRPGAREAVVFARRPGRFAVVFDIDGRRPPRQFDANASRHFFGHGVYSSDGKLLLSTENDIAGGRGVLGIRDASSDYAELGVFATGGIGPHDVALLSDKRTLVVANGGIDTDPDGRDTLAISEMQPSLAYIDLLTGDLLERVELEPSLRELSIRHLAVGADDTVVFGCQWEGSRLAHPPLIGQHRRGQKPVLIAAPDATQLRLKNYVGSVAVDASGEIAIASAPKGGLAIAWDIATARLLRTIEMTDVCGVSPTATPRDVLLTSGDGTIRSENAADASRGTPIPALTGVHWDNHLVILG